MVDQIGTGRAHGAVPTDPAELRLYEATHGNTAWVDPDPYDVAELINWYRTLPGCETGGSLHIVIEDDNCDDEFVSWCSGWASGTGDTCGAELAGLLKRMPVFYRVRAVMIANKEIH